MFPKAADVVYAPMCESNARVHSYQEDADGRLVHAAPAELVPPSRTRSAKKLQDVRRQAHHALAFSGGSSGSAGGRRAAAVAHGKERQGALEEDQQQRRLLDCGGRSVLTTGKAAAASRRGSRRSTAACASAALPGHLRVRRDPHRRAGRQAHQALRGPLPARQHGGQGEAATSDAPSASTATRRACRSCARSVDLTLTRRTAIAASTTTCARSAPSSRFGSRPASRCS